MSLNSAIWRRLSPVVFPALGACVVAYFAVHTVQGNRGLVAKRQLAIEIEQSRATLGELIEERSNIENRVNLISPNHVDLDMLDERARSVLNGVKPDELVYFYPRDIQN